MHMLKFKYCILSFVSLHSPYNFASNAYISSVAHKVINTHLQVLHLV